MVNGYTHILLFDPENKAGRKILLAFIVQMRLGLREVK